MSETKTIYTCIMGDYDELKEPINTPPNAHQHWRFICYTDNPNIRIIDSYENPIEHEKSVWEIRPVTVMDCGPAKTARWYKINFHKHIETKYSMWVDATFFINIDLNRWWRRFKQPFTVINHPFDDCAFTDLKSCIGAGKGDFWKLIQQAHEYKIAGLPENYGLISSGLLMRMRHPQVEKFCEAWWAEVEKYTERDQPCFTYVSYTMPGVFDSFNWNYTIAEEFIHVPHVFKTTIRNKKFEMLKKKNYGGH